MGRSKSTPSPAVKKSQLNTTPKTLALKSTPGKSGSKRPLPEESDSEEENHDLFPQNGFLKSKKGKFTTPDADVSVDELSAGATEDSEEEDDEDSDVDEDDDDDDGEEEDGDDDDEQDDDDDDEEEDEDDESDGESDEPIKAPSQNAGMPKATASQHSSADAKPAIPKVDKVHAADTKKSTAPNHTGLYKHLLIPNPPRDLPQLKKVLSERGFSVEHLEPLNLRVAVAKVSANSDTKNLPSGEKALSVDGKTVHFLLVEGSSDAIALLAPETSESLFITGIPKFVTMEMLLSKLPRGCQPVSNKLLDKGRRNQHFNAAFLGFSSKSDSATAFTALLNVKFGDRTINVAYSHSREAPNAEESKSARQFQVRILNAPKDAVTDQILPLFPGATKAYRTNTGHFFVEFPDEAALRKATAGQKVLQKNVLRLSVPGGIEGNVYLIRNIPFDASESDLRNVYPEASKISLNRRHDGAFDGSAVVEFPSAASAQSALQKGVTLKGRRLFGIPFFVEIRTEKMSVPKKQPKADQKAPKPSKKSEVPPQVGSGSEEESEDDGGESDDDDQIPQKFNVKETGDKEKEESATEDDEDEDESDDDDEDEDDEEDESAASEDEGIEDASDEEMPMEKPREKSKFTPSKNQFGGQDKKDRGSNWRGGRGFSPRGNRGFGGRGRGGPNRGGHDGGFKHRGGGGGRGRGNFQRGRGKSRGN